MLGSCCLPVVAESASLGWSVAFGLSEGFRRTVRGLMVVAFKTFHLQYAEFTVLDRGFRLQFDEVMFGPL